MPVSAILVVERVTESIQARVDAGGSLLTVIQALERADGPVETAEYIDRLSSEWRTPTRFPATEEIRSILPLLAHPCIGVVIQNEDRYRVRTDYENGSSWCDLSEILFSLRSQLTTANGQAVESIKF